MTVNQRVLGSSPRGGAKKAAEKLLFLCDYDWARSLSALGGST